MEVSFIYQNRCFPRRFGDELAQIILRSNASRRIVRVADINQPVLRRS